MRMRRSCCAFHWNKNSENLETYAMEIFRESFQKNTDILEFPTSKSLDWKFWKLALAVFTVNMHILFFPLHPPPVFITRKRDFQRSLRTKRFRGVGEQRKSEKLDFRREKWCESQKVRKPRSDHAVVCSQTPRKRLLRNYFQRSNIWWGSTPLFDR